VTLLQTKRSVPFHKIHEQIATLLQGSLFTYKHIARTFGHTCRVITSPVGVRICADATTLPRSLQRIERSCREEHESRVQEIWRICSVPIIYTKPSLPYSNLITCLRKSGTFRTAVVASCVVSDGTSYVHVHARWLYMSAKTNLTSSPEIFQGVQGICGSMLHKHL
jgi:hypothetical protein